MKKASGSTARERYIAKTGKKGQPGPLARILSKSRTGKPSPHTDPKPRKRRTLDDYKKFLDKYAPKKIRKMAPAQPRKRMTADDLKKLMGRKKAGRATPGMKKAQPMAMKKGGPARRRGK
tara:strand:+ start:741 stop:1100 length:360 start_codon:yes stop_codon:yes gene_type:complete